MTNTPADPTSQIVKAITDPMTENAKAVQETAKAVQKGLDTAKGLGAFVERIIGPAADHFGHTLGDRAAHLRLNQRNKILMDVQRRVDAREIHPDALKELPFADAIRFIEAASIESEEEVQALWSRLISNAVDPNNDISIKKIYFDLLNSLSTPEVYLLDLIWKIERISAVHLTMADRDKARARHETIVAFAEAGWRKVSESDADIAVQNLIRLRCIAPKPSTNRYNDMFMHIKQGDRWATVDPGKMIKLLNYLYDSINSSIGIKRKEYAFRFANGSISQHALDKNAEKEYVLTTIGRDLMRACHEDAELKGKEGRS